MADFSDADIQSLAQKLTQFKQTLTQGELAAMATVIERGMPQAEDVAGFQDRRDRPAEGALGAQVGDPTFNPIFDLFGGLGRRERPGERK